MTQLLHVHVMARRPACGLGMRRLARDIGNVAALRWQKRLLNHTLRVVIDPRWSAHLHLVAGRGHEIAAGQMRTGTQAEGHLGERMYAAMRSARGRFVIIGSDCPGLKRRHIAAAFCALNHSRWVVGPARDGGFWLIGAHAPLKPLATAPIRWSHEETLRDTLSALAGLGAPARLEMLHDVDHARDLRLQ